MLTLDIDRQYSQNDIPSNDELEQWAAMAYLGNSSAEAALVIVDEAAVYILLSHVKRKSIKHIA